MFSFFGVELSCPYFVPREILNDGSWPHPSRLPLGAGWTGACCASGHEIPADESQVREHCNLGYATACHHLPLTRDWDAVRFSVARANSERVTFFFSCERSHVPIEHGTLTYDLTAELWRNPHPDARVQRLATSYLHAYRVRQQGVLI